MNAPTLPAGILIGHAADDALKSGVTVILPDKPAIAGVHVAGGGPGTRETDLLRPESTIERADAIVLAGGSAFGLAAADSVTAWLAGKGRGYRVGSAHVPIVPAAILFDLLNGGDKRTIPGMGDDKARSPYFDLGWQACEAAAPETGQGTLGAGTGATTADLKGGFGAASDSLTGGAIVAALAAVNAAGSVTFGDGPHFRAAPFERDGEFGGLGVPARLPPSGDLTKLDARPRANTTLAVIATDLSLTKAQARRLAIAAHDGIALAVYPAHTPLDGDTVFALSTGEKPLAGDPLEALTELGAA
ncbi:MAG TPA: P1 family peptidase, partial [Afifellaceae bacterium]|nr:P1 family peptidase [Afifellaceae bacterium]